MKRLVTWSAVLGLALVAGCGDDTETVTESATSSEGEPLTKAEFIEQADGICQTYMDKTSGFEKAFTRQVKADDAQGAAESLDQFISTSKPGVEELAALSPPAADAEVVGEIIAAREQNLVIGARLVDALRAEDPKRQNAIFAELSDIDKEADALAKGYGLQVCGQGDG